MSGRSMLAGLTGAMEGFRFGREIMGDTPEDRQARAALEAAQTKAGIADRKQDFEMTKFGQQQDMERQKLAGVNARHQDNLERQDRQYELQNKQFDRTGQWHEEGAPLREAQTLKAKDEVQQLQENRAYQQEAQQNLGDFQSVAKGTGTPEQVERVKRMMPWLAQDAEKNAAALRSVAQRALPYIQAGDFKTGDAMFSTPEGQQALNAAFGTFYSRRVGQTDPEGKYVVTGARAVGVTRSPDGKSLGIKIETTQEPTPEYRKAIEQQIGAAASEEERARLREQLNPQSYVADLTEGRLPVSQGGQTKYFSQEEFGKGMSFLDKLAEVQRDDPDMMERFQAQLEGKASGESRAKGLERANINVDKWLQRKATEENLKLNRERLRLQKEGKDPTEKVVSGWRGFIGRQMPGPDEDDVGGERQRLANMQAAGEDIIRASKGNVSLGDVMKQVQAQMPVSEKDAPGMLDGFFDGGGAPQSAGLPADVTQAELEIGAALRRGEISKEEALKRWKAMEGR